MHCFPPDSRSHGRHVGSPGFKFINGAFFASKGSLAIRRHQGFLLQTARPSAAREERSEPRSKRFNNLRPSSISSMRGPLYGQSSETPPHIIQCTRYKLRGKLGKIAIGGPGPSSLVFSGSRHRGLRASSEPRSLKRGVPPGRWTGRRYGPDADRPGGGVQRRSRSRGWTCRRK